MAATRYEALAAEIAKQTDPDKFAELCRQLVLELEHEWVKMHHPSLIESQEL